MAPHRDTSDSSEDEGAPEAVSLSQSKKRIQSLETERKNAEIIERQNKRNQNRELDRKLKERAEENKMKGKKKAGNEEDGLEARMQRAMQEAQEEMDGLGESDEGEYEEFSGIAGGSGGASGDGESDEGSESDEDEEEDDDSDLDDEDDLSDSDDDEARQEELPQKSKKKVFNPDHLPDELFTAAFASQTAASKRKADDQGASTTLKSTKRKRSNVQKDVVIGSRAIRILPGAGQPTVPSVAPSRKVRKFLDRSLALKGGKQRTKGWERRPANIGVLRRDGPASNFVRNP
ncbi:hypothetical protein B0H34DRAFT_668340 [Crassisporium funariophilum]|nr:hypothetical protein B0H34DRAFT_668340 [Crassisporium funariophilum]